ncbi:hypothetical protein EUGRSUZ_H00203 [Eucalyptus grandis]|uniref:Uncharacterized protein n=2 Tax=Eucalyptus grandis TaxID=71139 RepID=A0ACC3JLD8_EUCGR|nr:hypothetical protein EUGRSUZ_H00203 [Eucalyptus grandis]
MSYACQIDKEQGINTRSDPPKEYASKMIHNQFLNVKRLRKRSLNRVVLPFIDNFRESNQILSRTLYQLSFSGTIAPSSCVFLVTCQRQERRCFCKFAINR